MSTAIKPISFEDYLAQDEVADLPDARHEFVDGEWIELPPESEQNDFLARFLLFALASSGVMPLRQLVIHTCEVEVPVLQLGTPRNRFPDLVVLHEEHLSLTQRRLTITLTMRPPLLVAEVVSPGDLNRERDYQAKRAQYERRGIPEYWLIDPEAQLITVLQLEGKQYSLVGEFSGSDRLRSALFPAISLTAEQLLRGQV